VPKRSAAHAFRALAAVSIGSARNRSGKKRSRAWIGEAFSALAGSADGHSLIIGWTEVGTNRHLDALQNPRTRIAMRQSDSALAALPGLPVSRETRLQPPVFGGIARVASTLLVSGFILAGCSGGSSGSGSTGNQGQVGSDGNRLFLTDDNESGHAAELLLREMFWGRLVDVHDVDASGQPAA